MVDCVSKKIKNEAKEQKSGFIIMSLDTIEVKAKIPGRRVIKARERAITVDQVFYFCYIV